MVHPVRWHSALRAGLHCAVASSLVPQLYVELNVAHEMEPEEVERLPAKHAVHQVSHRCCFQNSTVTAAIAWLGLTVALCTL